MYWPGYGLEHQTTVPTSFLERESGFSLPPPDLGPIRPSIYLALAYFSPRVKRPGRETDPTPPPSV